MSAILPKEELVVPEKYKSLQVDRVVERRFNTCTGEEMHPVIPDIAIMQDWVDIAPGDEVQVTIELVRRARKRK